MATANGKSDAQNLLIVVGVGLISTMAAVFWLSESMQSRANTSKDPTFQSVKPIAEGTERKCTHCQGHGRAACYNCGGHGKVHYINKGLDWCSVCAGYKTYTCQQCKGSGKVSHAQPGVIRANPKK